MKDGVTVMDPATTWIDADVQLAQDVTILPGTQLLGATVVAEDAVIGPDTTLKDCEVGAGRPRRTHARRARRDRRPGARSAPSPTCAPAPSSGSGARSARSSRPRTPQIGDGAKVPHLSYVGDAEIGEGTNIGAGTIFANYDGVAEAPHRRRAARQDRLQQHVRRAGHDRRRRRHRRRHRRTPRRPPGALAVSSGPQRNLEGWAQSKRPGTPQAEAAARRRVTAGDQTADPGVGRRRPE